MDGNYMDSRDSRTPEERERDSEGMKNAITTSTTTKSECCMNCERYTNCDKESCPCHTPQKCKCGKKFGIDGHEPDCFKSTPQMEKSTSTLKGNPENNKLSTPQEPRWVERFNNLNSIREIEAPNNQDSDSAWVPELKSFIKEQLALQREEILGEASIHVGNQIKTALALQKEKMMGAIKEMQDGKISTDEWEVLEKLNNKLSSL